MYKKIWGLKKLEEMAFPVPPYVVINFRAACSKKVKNYLQRQIQKVKVPNEPGDRSGVTIRVSMPGKADMSVKHGSLHLTSESKITSETISKHEQYGPKSKIIVQHTVDAKCSGGIVKEHFFASVECLYGDAPPLLEGTTNNFESWRLNLENGAWKIERNYILNGNKTIILTRQELRTFSQFIQKLPSPSYVEWSISANGKFYFYEFGRLRD